MRLWYAEEKDRLSEFAGDKQRAFFLDREENEHHPSDRIDWKRSNAQVTKEGQFTLFWRVCPWIGRGKIENRIPYRNSIKAERGERDDYNPLTLLPLVRAEATEPAFIEGDPLFAAGELIGLDEDGVPTFEFGGTAILAPSDGHFDFYHNSHMVALRKKYPGHIVEHYDVCLEPENVAEAEQAGLMVDTEDRICDVYLSDHHEMASVLHSVNWTEASKIVGRGKEPHSEDSYQFIMDSIRKRGVQIAEFDTVAEPWSVRFRALLPYKDNIPGEIASLPLEYLFLTPGSRRAKPMPYGYEDLDG